MDVDVVVLWVDGGDPAWQVEKNKYSPVKKDDSNANFRYRDWGLMKYWFRAIEKFMPWVRTVHFVTWGHLPPFLDTSCPKLHIVRHEDYLPPEALPTFSSRPLEMNLHRIKGLAEHFVYFNDDMFITRPMDRSMFFDETTMLPKAQFGEVPLWLMGNLGFYQYALANDIGIINKHFPKDQISKDLYRKKFLSRIYPKNDRIRTAGLRFLNPSIFCGLRSFHAPAAYRKSVFEEIWEKEPEVLKTTTVHKFRAAGDVTQHLALWWQEVSGNFVPGIIDNATEDVDMASIDRVCREIENQEHDMICLNDPDDEVDVDVLSARVTAAFEKILPEKSSFEL